MNREQPQSTFRVTTLSRWQVSQSPPPPVAKMRVPVFAGNWECEIELCQTGVICFTWRQRSWSCGVFKTEFQMHFQWKWQLLQSYDISVLQQVGIFSMGSPARWRFGICSSGNSLASRWRDVPLMREFQMWRRRCKHIGPHWFEGRQLRFWWTWSTISWKYFIIHKARRFRRANIQPEAAASYFQQFTGSWYSLWITGNSLWHRDYPGHAVYWCQLYCQGKYIFLGIDQYLFSTKMFYFNFYNIFICITF